MISRKEFAVYVRNFTFGVEDSLVSTVGFVSGIAAAGMGRNPIILTGVVLITVEAFSMAVGSFLSEESAEEYMKHKEAPFVQALSAALVMFFSYFISGFIPLLPYVFWDIGTAIFVSIFFSCVALFALGAISAEMFHVRVIRGGLRMMLIGGLAILVGVLIGKITR